jgi:hypothetical protein
MAAARRDGQGAARGAGQRIDPKRMPAEHQREVDDAGSSALA